MLCKACWPDVLCNKYWRNWTSYRSISRFNRSPHLMHSSKTYGPITLIWFRCNIPAPVHWKLISRELANERFRELCKTVSIRWHGMSRIISTTDFDRYVSDQTKMKLRGGLIDTRLLFSGCDKSLPWQLCDSRWRGQTGSMSVASWKRMETGHGNDNNNNSIFELLITRKEIHHFIFSSRPFWYLPSPCFAHQSFYRKNTIPRICCLCYSGAVWSASLLRVSYVSALSSSIFRNFCQLAIKIMRNTKWAWENENLDYQLPF